MSKDTKRLIADTVAELSKHKPIDKITVKDVVSACHVSRQTFYYHFQDLPDVMEWMIRNSLEELLEESKHTDSPETTLYLFVSMVADHVQGLLPKLLASRNRVQIERLMLQAVRTYLQELIRQRKPDLKIGYSDLQVAIDFYSYGLTGLLLEYGTNDTIDAAQLTGQMYRILNGGILENETILNSDINSKV